MPEPAMRDPGGDLWVVGSEGRLGAGESVCARAFQVAYAQGARRPCTGAADSGCFGGFVLVSSSSLCPLQGSARNLPLVRA